jgi:hypothetical protein
VKYHLFVLQVNGDVTGQQECDSRKALSDPAARQWIQEYSELLEKQFADNPEKRGKFWFPADESAHYRWKWDQFNPLSALCVMEVAGQPISACVFLYGFEPLHDAAAVDGLQTIMVKWLEGTSIEPGFGLKQITERPAIISIPFATKTEENDQRAVSNLLCILGLAFFRQSAAFLDQVDRFWQRQGVTRVGPKPTWPRP